jgi:altronate dehydratase small subunit
MEKKALLIHREDNVAVAVTAVRAGETIFIDRGNGEEVTLRDDIAFGHKIALMDRAPGEPIVKYGEVIGQASKHISRGEHVHVHNMESRRGRGDWSSTKKNS